MKNNRGITLIEVMVVISIISIIFFISTLNRDILLDYKERKELMEFKNDIIYGRNKAIIESTKYFIDIRPYSNSYVIYKQELTRIIIKRKTFENGIVIYRNNIEGDEIIFTHSGAPEKSGTIYLRNRKGKTIRLTVTPAVGKVNMYFD